VTGPAEVTRPAALTRPANVTGPAEPRLSVVFVLGLASGGTASHVSALADGCRAARLAVSVLGPAPTLARLSAGIDRRVVPIGDVPHPARDAVAFRRLRRWIAARQADVVHAHGVRAGALAAMAIASLRPRARPALAVTVHNAPPDSGPARLVYTLLERICARRADVVLCVSADLLARLRRLGAAAEQFDVPAPQRPAPEDAQVTAARAELGAYGRPVVLAVARLASQKGLDVLIDAAVRWRDRDPQPRTVIAGDGPLSGDLRARARQAGADVMFLGARDDVPALLAAADVVVVPSRWEARALIIQEAMRSGRPIVATRVGGTAELTGTDGALLVPPDDAAALADAVAAVLDDASLAARLGAAARTRSAAFPAEQDAVRAALAVYARLAAHRGSRPQRHSRTPISKLG
jgi:glycosyltransferase involved in cell wall biosynthesis